MSNEPGPVTYAECLHTVTCDLHTSLDGSLTLEEIATVNEQVKATDAVLVSIRAKLNAAIAAESKTVPYGQDTQTA